MFNKDQTNVEKGQVLAAFPWSWVGLCVDSVPSPDLQCMWGIPEGSPASISVWTSLVLWLEGFVLLGSPSLVMPCCRLSPARASSTPSSPSPACTCNTGITCLCMEPMPWDSESARACCFNRHGKLMPRNDCKKGHRQNTSLLLPLLSSYHPFCRSFWIASF